MHANHVLIAFQPFLSRPDVILFFPLSRHPGLVFLIFLKFYTTNPVFLNVQLPILTNSNRTILLIASSERKNLRIMMNTYLLI